MKVFSALRPGLGDALRRKFIAWVRFQGTGPIDRKGPQGYTAAVWQAVHGRAVRMSTKKI